MRKFEDVDLHDAVVAHINLDVESRILEVHINYYGGGERDRKPAIIRFSKVISVSNVLDLEALRDNSSAGNINYWAPVQGGVTYIYLVNGCIAILAEEIEFNY